MSRPWARRIVSGLGGLVALCLAGCAVGPNYRRPELSLPEDFRGASARVDPSAVAELPWWEVFRDPVLAALVAEGVAGNFDLAAAAARVEQARNLVGVTRADLLPRISYQAAAQRARTFSPVASNPTTNVFLGTLQMAWEIDVWGRIRRATEASLAGLRGAEDVRRGLILSVTTEVARAYLELRLLDEELAIARRTEASFVETEELFTRQFLGGVGNRLATSRAAAALAEVRAVIPELERQLVVRENALSVLLGRVPDRIPRSEPGTSVSVAPEIPVALPSSLLERRPDVLAAEQRLVGANAEIGVAVANFLPSVGLTSLFGGQSAELEDVFGRAGGVWSMGGSLLGPLFQGGRLLYDYRGRQAVAAEAEANYRQVVLGALAEVADALVAREKLGLQRQELQKQVDALRESVRLSRLRYTGGLAGYFEVLEAQQQLFPAERLVVRTVFNEQLAVVDLFKALGGGWRVEAGAAPPLGP